LARAFFDKISDPFRRHPRVAASSRRQRKQHLLG
jgi:hypothetical protein